MGPINVSFTGAIVFLCLTSAIAGWAVIEFLLWLLSSIAITIK